MVDQHRDVWRAVYGCTVQVIPAEVATLVTARRTLDGSSVVPASEANTRPWSSQIGPATNRSTACRRRCSRSTGNRLGGSRIVRWRRWTS
jgi:hypothetical protein